MQKSGISNLTHLFKDTLILDPLKNKNILFQDLWEKNTKPLLLIHWLRRFGCVICRAGAKNMTDGLREISEKNPDAINYVSIGLEKLGYEEFEKENFWQEGKIYIDESKQTYKALNFGKTSAWSFWGMLNPYLYIESYRAKQRGITGNLKGNGPQLGGTIIVDKNGEIIFSHEQQSYMDFPKNEDIEETIKNYLNKRKF